MIHRTRNETPGTYSARRCGTTGCEILNPDGEVIAWTADEYWGSLLAWLLTGTNVVGRPLPTKSEELSDDPEPTAREAISHLAYNGISFEWDLPGEPSEAVRRLIEPYFSDGEIVRTLGDLACRYVMKALADDHLGITGITIPEKAPKPDETRPPERR